MQGRADNMCRQPSTVQLSPNEQLAVEETFKLYLMFQSYNCRCIHLIIPSVLIKVPIISYIADVKPFFEGVVDIKFVTWENISDPNK